jgi:hypothetical protein
MRTSVTLFSAVFFTGVDPLLVVNWAGSYWLDFIYTDFRRRRFGVLLADQDAEHASREPEPMPTFSPTTR